MKIRHKKVAASGIAVALAGILGVGALLQTSVSVQASSAMMPGIEQIVNDTTADKPFKILEIVDETDDAEIGYYVSGQEPYVKLYSYTYKYTEDGVEKEKTIHFQTLEEGLEQLPNRKLRTEFASNTKTDSEGNAEETGIKDVKDVSYQAGTSSTDEQSYPLSYSEYTEKYFLTDDEKDSKAWTQIDFRDISTGESRTDIVKEKGNYQENAAGTGDYTKQDQEYYPIRSDSDEDKAKTEKYRENIQNFYYADNDGAGASYYLDFEEVDNSTVNQAFKNEDKSGILADYNYNNGGYGYYENVYNDLTEEIVQNILAGTYTFPGENMELSKDLSISDSDKKLVLMVPDKDGTRTASASSFSDGEDDFSSINGTDTDSQAAEGNQTSGQPDISSDESQSVQAASDSFSTGDFSDGTDPAADAGNTDTQTTDDAVSDTAFDSDPAALTDSAQTDTTKQPLIPYTQTEKDKNGQKVTELDPDIGTSANPEVYYGVTIDTYPYYQYTLISDMKKIVQCANANAAAVADGTFMPSAEYEENNITFQDGQYWYWIVNTDGTYTKTPISVVTQRQPVSYDDIRELPDLGYNYYYRVRQAYFCCKTAASADTDSNAQQSSQYFGWYSPSYPENQDVYIPVSDNVKTATHYISEAEYKLTPGTGNYDFVPDDNAEAQTVEVNHMYYQGGYTNHDWFKRYVFHLSPEDEDETVRKQFDNFKIEVTTMTAEKFNEMYGGEVSEVESMVSEAGVELVSIENEVSDGTSAGTTDTEFQDGTDDTETPDTDDISDDSTAFSAGEAETASTDSALSEYGLIYINSEKISQSAAQSVGSVPTVINAGKAADNSQTAQSFNGYVKAEDTDGHYVNTLVYFFRNTFTEDEENSLVNLSFNKNFNPDAGSPDSDPEFSSSDPTEGFEEILEYIESENKYRQLGQDESGISDGTDSASDGNSGLLDTALSHARAIEYIINYNYKRTVSTKDSINILEIEPAKSSSQLSGAQVAKWLNDGSVSVAQVTGCCNTDTVENVLNTDLTQIWTSGSKHSDENHWVKLTFEKISDIQGFTYTPRQDGSKDGVMVRSRVELYDASGKVIYTETSGTIRDDWYQVSNHTRENTILFQKTVRNVKSMKIIFEETFGNSVGNAYASAANITVIPATVSGLTQINVCCEESKNEDGYGQNMTDSDSGSYWHSKYSGTGHSGNHWLEIICGEESDFNGIEYMPRSNEGNGTITKFNIDYYDSDNNKMAASRTDCTWTKDSNGNFVKNSDGYWTYQENETISGVKKIRITVTASVNSENARWATCAELRLNTANSSNINITTMTASEFVGHIDDIGSEYDMIYIGSKKDTSLTNVDLTTGSGEMCYAHVGAGRGITVSNRSGNLLKLIGQLDIDYDNSWTGTDGRRRFAPINTYSEHGAGYYRGSGNDMTDQLRSELMEFVKSGYPVVIDSGLMSSADTVNTNKVDASSYYYQFMTEALKYDNVFASSELKNGSGKLGFFSNLAKPVIKFEEKPAEPPRANTSNTGQSLITSGELKYVFTIENDSDARPALTTYDCNLYLDLNFDGNLSEKESQDSYIEISDEEGNVLAQVSDGSNGSHYELQAGKKYTLIRKLPESYFKVITWKLEIKSNRNSYIHTSETGYAKQGRGEGVAPQTIRVVQLQAYKNGNNWDLSNKNGKFQTLLTDLKNNYDFDFDIQITPVSVNTVNQYTDKQQMKDLLANADMLIIGFTDGYDNIENDQGQVDEIVSFIKSGKSVLFSHDTTSYINYDQDKMYGKIADTAYGTDENVSIRTENWNFAKWGLELNKTLRSIVGMDRYGITSDETIGAGTQTVSELLKKGNELTDNNEVSFNDLMKITGDIAYQSGTRTSSYAQTQGYSNEYINYPGYDARVTKAQKVNDGAITQYPYVIGDEISVATTHGQYYQLGMEQDRDINGNSDGKSDVVVWYTLTDSYYGISPKDVRNNYYFYSKGNVIYTGAGHSGVNGDEEIQLFINAITAAANVTAVKPEAEFIRSLNPGAKTETVRYYMTDQQTWTETNIVNKDDGNDSDGNMQFFINVKDYNMVSSDLNQADLDKQEITMQFYIEDENGTVQEDSVTTQKLKDITGLLQDFTEYGGNEIKISGDGMFHTRKSNAFGFKIKNADIETDLRDSSGNGYRESCKIYARISSTVYLYGVPKTQTVWTSIDLKQRQLFDLD